MLTAFRTESIRLDRFEATNSKVAYAKLCRDGILEYRTVDGKRVRELRPTSANKDPEFLLALEKLALTDEHPSHLVTPENYDSLAKGCVVTPGKFDDDEATVDSLIEFWDEDILRRAQSGDQDELSLGYRASIVETPDGYWHDSSDGTTYRGDFQRVQVKLKPNHVALTRNGRAGQEIAVYFDSAEYGSDVALEIVKFDSLSSSVKSEPTQPAATATPKTQPTGKKKMTSVFKRDSREFQDVPEGFANWVHDRIDERDIATERADAAETALTELQQQYQELLGEKEDVEGRADGFELVAEKAAEVLSDEGYVWDSANREFVRTDGGKKKKKPVASDEELDDGEPDEGNEDMEDIEEEYSPPPKKGKKSQEKTDSQIIGEQIARGIKVRTDAIALLQARSIKYDSVGITDNMTPAEVQAEVLKAIDKDLDLDDKSDSYIEGRFDSALADSSKKGGSYADALSILAKTAKSHQPDTKEEGKSDANKPGARVSQNHKKPLHLSKRK